jgi:hypothetical protein
LLELGPSTFALSIKLVKPLGSLQPRKGLAEDDHHSTLICSFATADVGYPLTKTHTCNDDKEVKTRKKEDRKQCIA